MNLIDTHIPPKKKANQARIDELVEEFDVWLLDRNAFANTDKELLSSEDGKRDSFELLLNI